jgi:long-chain acyl-CoA synthetase
MLLSLAALIERQSSDAPAFQDSQTQLSYGELYAAIADLAARLADAPPTIGLCAKNSVEWVIADLAITAAGKTLVPMPGFFSADQMRHVMQDADIGLFLCDESYQQSLQNIGATTTLLTRPVTTSEAVLTPKPNATRVIYTSGTTGTPKGVRLGEAQLNFTMQALTDAISACADDRYLSVLPFALLLEELCGLHVPLMVGGSCIIDAAAAEAVGNGHVSALQESAMVAQPSVMVLVPELLRAWTAALMLSGDKAPESLRFLAVGGAKTPPEALALAPDLGLPAFEGYGLSECGSVVALNLPGASRANTVGRPLPGLDVKIIDGEITVAGANVMSGYLGQTPHDGPWATGDLGTIDEDGFLIVHGRKDSVLVNGFGRNVSPEWVEAMMSNDFRIGRAVLAHGRDGKFCALINPTLLGEALYDNDQYEQNLESLRALCAEAPAYARPDDFICINAEAASEAQLFTASGRPRRRVINEYVMSKLKETQNV